MERDILSDVVHPFIVTLHYGECYINMGVCMHVFDAVLYLVCICICNTRIVIT